MLQFLLKRKIIVGLFIAFTFGIGFYGVTNLDKELFPSVKFNQTLALVETNEMPAEDVEQFVTIPIEQVLDTIEGIENYESSSSSNESTFIVELSSENGDEITKEIESEIKNVTNGLHGVEHVTVMQASTEGQYELFMDISGGSLEEMSAFALDVVKPRLESLREVNDVFISGLEEKEILITPKSEKLDTYHLTQEDIISAIEQTNTNQSIGQVNTENEDTVIRWNTTLHSVKDIQNIPIQTDEEMMKLSDFATVKKTVNEKAAIAWKNGDPNFLLLQIGRTNGFTQIDMAESVRSEVEKIKQEHDTELNIHEIAAQADYVSNAIEDVTSNIYIGALIAFIVLLLFLRNFRATLIVGVSIPASVLLTIITMTFLDYSFNLISLVGLGLGIGMMVDASIVVLESIFKKKEQGKENIEAVISGTKEVVGAVLASMLTTIVVFVPIVLMDDEIGKMMIILTVVIAVTLISSVIVAFTLIPVLSENFLKVKKPKKSRFNFIQKYGNTIEWLTKKKRRRLGILSLFIIVFFSSFLLLTKIPMTLMPDILNRYAEIIVELEPGVNQEERDEIAQKMNESLEEIPDIDNNTIIDSMNMLLALVNMTPEEDKTIEQSEINQQIMKKFRALEKDYPIKSVGTGLEGTTSPPIILQVSGNNLDTLQEIGEDVTKKLEDLNYISAANLQVSESVEEYSIDLHERNMEEDMVSPSYLQNYVSQIFSDIPIGEIRQDDNVIPVIMRSDSTFQDKEALLDEEIMTINGEKKLSNYISLEKTTSLLQIDRLNGERYIRIVADTENADLGTINREVNKLINDLDVDQGYSVEIAGDLEQQQEAAQDILIIFAISLFLVFVVMAIQFNSLKHPFIILFIIPLTITGVIIGLFVTQKDLNIMSAIGVIMLVGIVLNNGILLIDRTRQLRNEGLHVNESLVLAGKERIRPIFMTTLTTVGGMLPLALATGTSSGYQSPLAVVIISGLLFSTLITLLLIPAVYLLMEDISNGLKRIFRRKKPIQVEEKQVKAQ